MRSLSDYRYWKFHFDCLNVSNFRSEKAMGGGSIWPPPHPFGRSRVNNKSSRLLQWFISFAKACEEYIKDEECFYQCEPSLITFRSGKGTVDRVPVCADYCNSWFDACKDDLTCAKDWLADFNSTGGQTVCKTDSPCKTFEQVRIAFLLFYQLSNFNSICTT